MSGPILGNIQGPPQHVPLGGEACEGRSAFRFKLDFSLGLTFQIDLTQFLQQGTIKSVQSLYIDNFGGTDDLTFVFDGTEQEIIIPANAQAYMPVLQANSPKFTVTCANASQIAFLQVLNFFVPPYMWGTTQIVSDAILDTTVSNGMVNVATHAATLTGPVDASGAIVAGGTRQVLLAANPARKRWMLSNPSTATEILQFSYVSNTGGLVDLPPGATWIEADQSVSGDEIWVVGATTAHAFTAYSW